MSNELFFKIFDIFIIYDPNGHIVDLHTNQIQILNFFNKEKLKNIHDLLKLSHHHDNLTSINNNLYFNTSTQGFISSFNVSNENLNYFTKITKKDNHFILSGQYISQHIGSEKFSQLEKVTSLINQNSIGESKISHVSYEKNRPINNILSLLNQEVDGVEFYKLFFKNLEEIFEEKKIFLFSYDKDSALFNFVLGSVDKKIIELEFSDFFPSLKESIVKSNTQMINYENLSDTVEKKFFIQMKVTNFLAVSLSYRDKSLGVILIEVGINGIVSTKLDGPDFIAFKKILEQYMYIQHFKQVVAKQNKKIIHLARLSETSEFAAGISHEINNPLTSIIHNTKFALKNLGKFESQTPKNKIVVTNITNLLNNIQTSAAQMLKIVRGLLAFVHDDTSAPMEDTPLTKILADALNFCQTKITNHCIELKIMPVPKLNIHCRSFQIAQVLLNLLNNAHDAILPLKTKWIQIEFALSDDKNYLKIMITDSGSGIDPKLVNKIMQPFFTTKEQGKGTGLGLSISKGILEEHQGDLYYDQNSKNTKFIITLPINNVITK